jgi:hypothetical protein
MSRSTDSWEDASPFAWIFGMALAAAALGGIARVMMDRRARQTAGVRRPDSSEDESLAGHPS